ncbi:hypothetical protein [Streptomyces sp. SP2-10]|uniref:hypothetical protein n=1 Tax=Streptomyces sp. SP2-10 TaxID=2873385 RepID=UPI001CA6436C|nr:hypothetical protein [Streptomyces sp. SP2-10]MBY8846209.1 hypothetical protein [Streptomyces sp. SP2-10]
MLPGRGAHRFPGRGTGAPGWDTYDTQRHTTMRIAQDWSLTHDLRAAERHAWHR